MDEKGKEENWGQWERKKNTCNLDVLRSNKKKSAKKIKNSK